jgi:hypothetical protein
MEANNVVYNVRLNMGFVEKLVAAVRKTNDALEEVNKILAEISVRDDVHLERSCACTREAEG